MNPDNILAVNIPNIITVGLMFIGFVILSSAAVQLFKRFAARMTPAEAGASDA